VAQVHRDWRAGIEHQRERMCLPRLRIDEVLLFFFCEPAATTKIPPVNEFLRASHWYYQRFNGSKYLVAPFVIRQFNEIPTSSGIEGTSISLAS
jgi:hypothetical protein